MKFKSLSTLIATAFLATTLASCKHEHTASDTWSYDETSHWHTCLDCDEELDKSDHIYSDWVITKEPTCTEKGQKEKVCTVCNYKIVEDIAPIGHKASDDWKFDETYHWHNCTSCDEILDKETHIFSEWTTVKEPTCEEAGIKEKACKCGYKINEIIEPTKHKYSGINFENLVLFENKPVKVHSFCENDSSHDLVFTLPSLNSGAYNSYTNYNGNCLEEGITTFYKLKDNEDNRMSLNLFADKLSNPEEFYTDVFSLEFNKESNKVLEKHNKLVSYRIVTEPTIYKEGKIELVCECGSKIEKTINPLSFEHYDVTYPTSENLNTVFKSSGLDLTSYCEERFFEYSEVLNELKTTEFVFESEELPELEMSIEEFNENVPTSLTFNYKGQNITKSVSYGTYATEKDKFEERIGFVDNLDSIGKIANRGLYIKYDKLLEATANIPEIKNYPNLKQVIENNPVIVYENQTREQIEHLLPTHTYSSYTIEDPTLEKPGKLTLNSTGDYKEIYVLPAINDEYYQKNIAENCTVGHNKYYILKGSSVDKILEFSIFNDNVTLKNELNFHRLNNSWGTDKHVVADYGISVERRPNYNSDGTIMINCKHCNTITRYTIPRITSTDYDFFQKDVGTLKQSYVNDVLLPQFVRDFEGDTEPFLSACRAMQYSQLEPVTATMLTSFSLTNNKAELLLETSYTKTELARLSFTYDENDTSTYKNVYTQHPTKECLLEKHLKLSDEYITNLVNSSYTLGGRDITSLKNVDLGIVNMSDAEHAEHRTVPHAFFIMKCNLSISNNKFNLYYEVLCQTCGKNFFGEIWQEEFMDSNNKVDVNRLCRCLLSNFIHNDDIDLQAMLNAFDMFLDNYPNATIHQYLP